VNSKKMCHLSHAEHRCGYQCGSCTTCRKVQKLQKVCRVLRASPIDRQIRGHERLHGRRIWATSPTGQRRDKRFNGKQVRCASGRYSARVAGRPSARTAGRHIYLTYSACALLYPATLRDPSFRYVRCFQARRVASRRDFPNHDEYERADQRSQSDGCDDWCDD
jgi:hypothetical protein